MPLHAHESGDRALDKVYVRPQFTQFAEVAGDVPRFRLAPTGIPAPAAYQIVHDELLLDGNARLNVQVCWEKFCRYWDVEARLVPVGPDITHLTADTAVAHCDENTIGVVAILGSTFDGAYEPVAQIAAALDALAVVLADLGHVVERLEGKGSAEDQKIRTGFHH